MRLARKLALLTAATTVALALAASTASAQEGPVEFVNEVSSVHCDVNAGNCEHHMVGTHIFTLHQFGSESIVSTCNDEFVLALGEDGNGFVDIYENDAATSGACTRIACNGIGEAASEVNWPITNTGEYTGPQAGEGHTRIRFCFDAKATPNNVGVHCTMELDIVKHATHKYALDAVGEECPISGMNVWIEVDGTWESEAMPHNEGGEHEEDIEIIHL